MAEARRIMIKVKRDLYSLSLLDIPNGPTVYNTLARLVGAIKRLKDITKDTTELANLVDALYLEIRDAMKDNVILHFFLHDCIADRWRNRPDIGRLLFLVSANAPANMRFLHPHFEGHLIQAVYAGSCSHVLTLLEAGADPNAVGIRMRTPLQLAIHLGKVEIAIALIHHEGTSLKLLDPNGRTLLQQCLYFKGYVKDFDPCDKQRLKPTIEDFLEIATALLCTDEARGLDLNSYAPLSYRPTSANAFLTYLRESSFPFQLMLETWTTLEDDNVVLAGKTAFGHLLDRSDFDANAGGLQHCAIEHKLLEAFDLLLPMADPNYSGVKAELATPLAATLRLSPCDEKTHFIKKLFERGADVNKPSRPTHRFSTRQLEGGRYLDKLPRPIDIACAQDTPDVGAILLILRHDNFYMYMNSPTGRDPKPMHSILKADGLNPEEKWHLIALLFIYGANIYDDHEDSDGDMMGVLDVIHGDETISIEMHKNYECLPKLAHLDSVAKALLLDMRSEASHLLKSNYVNRSPAPDPSIASAWKSCEGAPMWLNKDPKENAKFLTTTYKEWAPSRHFLFHKVMRDAIKTVMLVAGRLNNASHGQPSPDAMKKRKRTVVHKETQPRKQHDNADDDEDDPVLPAEIWHLICSFFQRGWWGRTVGDPIVIDD